MLLPPSGPSEASSASSCAVYEVVCVPETSPARGRLRLSGGVESLTSADFCRADWRHSSWLPRHLTSGAPSACFSCPTRSLLPRHGVNVPPLQACTTERYRLLQCLPTALLPQQADAAASSAATPLPLRAGVVDILLATSDNRGHGLFAMVERIANQVLFARSVGLVPYVHIGEYVFAEGRACEHGTVPYYDAAAGPNVWEYFFEQPSAWRPGEARVGSDDAREYGRRRMNRNRRPHVRSVQVVAPDALYSTPLHTQTYTGESSYDAPRRLAMREAAHSLFGNGSLVVRRPVPNRPSDAT